jgi:4,5-dihydroxyphthalate decarboxylase
MGANHWKQGFIQNYQILNAMCQYHYEQGLSERRLTPEELFARETHEMSIREA